MEVIENNTRGMGNTTAWEQLKEFFDLKKFEVDPPPSIEIII